jgi:dipeptidyl aminopeptidase/acylaminoacyl peptidase
VSGGSRSSGACFFAAFAALASCGPLPPYGARDLADAAKIDEVEIAPDATEIAFVWDRSGTPELWTAELRGGGAATPVQRTHLRERVYDLEYSASGDLVFAADHGGDERGDLWILRSDARAPALLARTDLAEAQASFSPDGSSLVFVADPDRSFRFDVMAMELATGSIRRLTREKQNVRSPRWSPDGRTIVSTVTPDDQKGELLAIDVASGAVRRIPAPRPEAILWPVEFLPDGLLLAATLNEEGFAQLCTVDLASGGVAEVGPGDWDVEQAAVAPRSGRVVLARNVRGESELLATDGAGLRRGDPPARLAVEGVVTSIAIDREGHRALIVRETSTSPPELLVVDLPKGRVSTAVEAGWGELDAARLSRAELRSFKSDDGTRIDAWVWRPPVPRLGSPPPAVVQVHGGPGSQVRPSFSPEAHALAQAGFLVVAPNYRGSSGYGRAFQDLNNKDWGGGDLEDLLAVVQALGRAGEIDGARVGITGESYGGYMTLRAITAAPEVFAAAVELYGMPDLVEDYRLTEDRFGSWYETEMGTPATHADLFRERSPIHSLDRVRAPLLVLQGANDTNVPKAESDLVVEALRRAGRPVEYVVYENEGHGFTRRETRLDAMARTVEFFVRHLGASTLE